MRVASATATASAPTKPATIGSKQTRASGRQLQEQIARGDRRAVAHDGRIGRQARRTTGRCRAGRGACRCCRRPRPCRSTWRARRTGRHTSATCWLSSPTMRVCSLRRLPGSNWAKAMRDMRSPPKTACGLRLETEASCSPEPSSSSVVTTLVVPTSMARPKRMEVVSPRSTDEDPAGEGRDRRAGRIVAQRLRQPGEHTGRHVGRGDADGRGQLLDIGGLVMLLARQRDLHQLLVDPGVDRHAARPGRGRRPGSGTSVSSSGGASSTVTDSIGSTLAGQAIALAHQRVAELDLVTDGGRRHRAGHELHAAGGAPSATAAGGGDVDAGGVGGLEDARAGRDGKLTSRLGAARTRRGA